jgi:hypothetical protein
MSQQQARICQALHDLFPASQVLIVTRGFRSCLHSLYSEYVKEGGDLAYRAFLTTHRELLLQWLDIDYLVQLYGTVFGQQNVIVLPYERLRDDPAGFLAALEQRLGLDHHPFAPHRVNPSLGPRELYWYAAISRHLVAPLADRLSTRSAGRLYLRYANGCVRPNRLRPLVQLMDRVLGRQGAESVPPDGYLDAFRNKATILRQYPLYAGYVAEYLLED